MRQRRAHAGLGYEGVCDVLANTLRSRLRHDIFDQLIRDDDRVASLARLRTAMRSHVFKTSSVTLELDAIVARLDARTRRDGFHVLLEWHHTAYRFIEEEIPVLMLDYFQDLGIVERPAREVLPVLLDYYFLHLLGLCAMRAWDEGDPGQNLDRVSGLLADLQGPNGSGFQFMADVETLLFLAISGYEPDDLAYHRLLEKVESLDEFHRLKLALVAGPILGCHLRWGFSALYECDLDQMRVDNFVDYPWLFFAVATLVREYARLHRSGATGPGRDRVVEALLGGLTPDPAAFVGEAPASLAAYRTEHSQIRELLSRHREALLRDFEVHRPSATGYSPLGLLFNFPHNAVFAMVLMALRGDEGPHVPLNALLRGELQDDARLVAQRLTAYAAADPEQRGARWVLGVEYDPEAARDRFATTLDTIGNEGGGLDRIRESM